MRVLQATMLLGFAALIGCQPAGLTPQQEIVQRGRVEERVQQWNQHLNNAAIDQLLAMYDESETVMSIWTDGSRGVGQEEHEGALRNFYGMIQFVNFNAQNPEIEVLSAGVAVVTFRHSVDMVLNDTRRDPFSGLGTLVWVRSPEDDTWRIHTQHLSRNP